MKKIRSILTGFLIVLSLLALPAVIGDAVLAANTDDICKGVAAIGGGNACNNAETAGRLPAFIKTIINLLLFLIGAVAVVMIIVGGIRYTTSNGDQSKVTIAKNTIMYAVVGVVVALLSYAIVNFVVDAI